jgi:hypothetical protein
MIDEHMKTWDASWDVLILGGTRMPGIARVEIDAPTGIDKQKARSTKKARIVDSGIEAAVVSVELELDPSEFGELKTAMNILRPRGKTAPQRYLRIEHPLALVYSINQVMIGKIGTPQIGPGGNFFLHFEAIEHVPEPAKLKKAKPATSNDAAGWAGIQDRIDKLNQRPSSAVEANFTAPEDITDFTAQSGREIFIPEPSFSAPP